MIIDVVLLCSLRIFWKKSYKALILGWFQSGKPPFNFSFPYCSFVHFCFIINMVCCFVVIPFLLCLLQSLIFFIRKCFMFLFLLLSCSMVSCCYHVVFMLSCCHVGVMLSCWLVHVMLSCYHVIMLPCCCYRVVLLLWFHHVFLLTWY